MKVKICYKVETRLDDEVLDNVEDICTIYDDEIEFTYNNSKAQYENDIKVKKTIPRKLLSGLSVYDF